jgi:hypothetical protein
MDKEELKEQIGWSSPVGLGIFLLGLGVFFWGGMTALQMLISL